MPGFPTGVTAKTVRGAVLGALAIGAVLVAAPPASASHRCDREQEICYWRLAGYTGGSRAFTNEDATYANDYYDNLSPTKSLNDTTSSYVNYHITKSYRICQRVNQAFCTKSLYPMSAASDLRDKLWYDGIDMDNTISSHVVWD